MDVLIVDDDRPTGLYLQHIVSQIPGFRVLGTATSGEEAIQFTREHKPQLVFLDIDMPGMSGLETARALTELHNDLIFIFATAYTNYALEAFEVYCFDYILKPFNEERIKKTLGKLNTSIKGQLMTSTVKQESIPVHSEGRTYFLYPEEILYIESSRANILIKTSHREFRLKASLTDWEQRLAPFGFVASHRSYLVNTKEIKEISRYGYSYNLRLKSGHNIPLSRSCARKIKKNLSSL